MELAQALAMLALAASNYHGTLEEHKALIQAHEVIQKECVAPAEAKKKKEMKKELRKESSE